MPELGVVMASTREGRGCQPVTDWFVERTRAHGGFGINVLDLKAIDLPLLEEPNHPRLQKYTQEKTKQWAATVAGMDAFVFVTPEYNFSMPPALVNALDHVYVEWNYKAAGFVSYGGVSGGTRSVQMAKQLVAALKMVPLVEAVTIPFYQKSIDASTKTFKGGDEQDKAAKVMLDELMRWTTALASLRR